MPDWLDGFARGLALFFTDGVWGNLKAWWALPPGERVGSFVVFAGTMAALLTLLRWGVEALFKREARLRRERDGARSRAERLADEPPRSARATRPSPRSSSRSTRSRPT